MLQWINDRMKVIGWFFILPLALVFAVWGVHGLIDFTASQDRGLRVNGTEVNLERLREAYQQQIAEAHRAFPDEIPAEIQTRLRDGVVDEFVAAELLRQKVEERRFVVGDQAVVQAIQEVPNFQVDGKFNRDSYLSLLRARGISVTEFEASQREELRSRQLQAGLFLSSFATPKEAERAAALRGETREVAFAVVPSARFVDTVRVDDAAVQAYYERNKSNYMTPETVTLSYVRLKLDDVAKQVLVDDAALRGYYDSVKDRYVAQEQRRARHILIQSGSDDAAAQKKAEALYAQATAPGADFAALATANSQDAGSAPQGGDLGWAERSFFVGPFADALFAMQPGEVSKPVKTQFGWHVIRLEEVRAGAQKTFEEVRAEIDAEYRRTEAERLFGERQEKLDELAFENSGSLEPLAKELGLTIETVPGFRRDVGGGPFTATPAVTQAAFSGDVLGGQNSRALELAPGDVVVLRAADHAVPALQPLESIRAQVEQGARRELAEREARAAAERLAAQVKAGTSLDAALRGVANVVPAVGEAPPQAIRFQPPRTVTRTDGGVPPALLTDAFRAPSDSMPASGTAALGQGDHGVWVVTAAKPGVAQDPIGERRTVAAEKARNDLLGYVQAMRERAEIHVNPTLFE